MILFIFPTLCYYGSCFQPQMAWGRAEGMGIWERLRAILEQIAQDKPITALEKTPPQEEKFKEMVKHFYSPPKEERMQEEKVTQCHYYSL